MVFVWDEPMTVTPWIAGAFLANLVIGAGLVVGVYTLMERQIAVGAVGGLAVGAGVIYAQATVGEQWLSPTVAEMKLLVLAAAVGAVGGVLGAVLVFEPEL